MDDRLPEARSALGLLGSFAALSAILPASMLCFKQLFWTPFAVAP